MPHAERPVKSALDLANAIKRKDLSPVEAVQACLAVVDRKNPTLNAIIWRRDEELLREARAAEAALMRGEATGAFFGVPLPIKDLTEVRGERVTHGSRITRDKIGRYDATVIQLLRQAGFLFMGRTNAPEFGTMPVTENELYGATRNPWNPAHTPGGSSGGAAAAVASGMAWIAHASDGGGSIRIPAACTGLVGLKPSRGRVPKGPFLSEVLHGFTTDGCVSTTIADTAAFLDAISDCDPNAWYGVPKPATSFLAASARQPRRLKIGFTTQGPLTTTPSASVVDAVTKTATLLATLGHEVYEATVDWSLESEQLARDFLAVWCTSTAYYNFSDWSELEPLNQSLREMAARQSSAAYTQAVVRLQMFSRRVVNHWGRDFDLLLTPTIACEPPPIGWLMADAPGDVEHFSRQCQSFVPYLGWCNITGQPAISLPTAVAASGLPVGAQLVGPPYGEDLLLMVGRELEEALDWAASLPV